MEFTWAKWGALMKEYLKLFRVKHYIKNLLVFFPLLFSRKLFSLPDLIVTFTGFWAFSFTASIIYIINDINDVENDRRHPTKCNRPIASGKISLHKAKVAIFLLGAIVIFLNAGASETLAAGGILIAYLCCNIAYSRGLKNFALLDVFLLTLGYILRIYYGAILTHTEVSSWLYMTVLSMSFFLGFGKRRNELKKQGNESRKVLKLYNWAFLDKIMYMCLGITIVFYSLWCERMATGSNYVLLFTIPLVFLICMRYSMDIEGESDGDPIEVLTRDYVLIALAFLYAVLIVFALYFSF